VLLLLRRSNLVGVVAHERKEFSDAQGSFRARKLQVVAVAKAWQGKRFHDGTRPSDVLMSAAIGDIANRDNPHTRVIAAVHQENKRSIALLGRHGLSRQVGLVDQEYIWLTTE
jgi:hypothetical protein